MVVLFVVLTIILFIAIDYFLKRKRNVAPASDAVSRSAPLINKLNSIPPGVFLQPSFTWGKIMDTGNLMIGIQPIIWGLIGKPEKMDTLEQGTKVKKGDPLLKLHTQNKQLTIKSPMDGLVISVNPDYQKSGMENNWLYGIEPLNISSEIPNWFVAEKSNDWLKEKYAQIKSFLIKNIPTEKVGLTMADGGDLPVGVLTRFDQKVWNDFETSICQ